MLANALTPVLARQYKASPAAVSRAGIFYG
jgi:hypothetical protein